MSKLTLQIFSEIFEKARTLDGNKEYTEVIDCGIREADSDKSSDKICYHSIR